MRKRSGIPAFVTLFAYSLISILGISPAKADSNLLTLRAGPMQTLTLIKNVNKTYALAPSGGILYPVDTSTSRSNFGPSHDQNFTIADLALALEDTTTVRKMGYSGSGNYCPVMSDNPTWARYSFEVTSGTFPSGVELGCDGILNGMPTDTGTAEVSIRVCDFISNCTTVNISIQIRESTDFQWNANLLESSWGLRTTLPPLGSTLNSYITNNRGVPSTFTCSGSLAPELSCDSTDGVVGTLTNLGTYIFRLVANLGSKSDAIMAKVNVCLTQAGCTDAQAAADRAAADRAAAERAAADRAAAERAAADRAAADRAAADRAAADRAAADRAAADRAAEAVLEQRKVEIARATAELQTILTNNAKPDLATFKAAGFEAVTEKTVNKISNELLLVPEDQRGDMSIIKDVILRVATVDRLSTPETAKYIQPADLVAIRALSVDNPKKQAITYALKKLDPSKIDTYKELLVEIAKQEAAIKVRAEKIAAIQARMAVRSSKR